MSTKSTAAGKLQYLFTLIGLSPVTQRVDAVVIVDAETGEPAVFGGGSSGGLTDAQLRASPVPVSGPLTNTELRAAAVPISAAALPLMAGAATSALQTTGNTSLTSIDAKSSGFTVTTSVTRPADTTAYSINDAIADSTTAPTAGGYTLASVVRASGLVGILTDMVVMSSNDPATPLQGEVWIYDSALTTAQLDNALYAPAVADRLKLVAVVPFTLVSVSGGSGTSGSVAHVQGINAEFTAVGSANLRFQIKAKNAYTPASAEVITVRIKTVGVN